MNRCLGGLKPGGGFHRMHKIIAMLLIGIGAALFLICQTNTAHKKKQECLHQDVRDNTQAERDKQTQEAKDKGDFDRWS